MEIKNQKIQDFYVLQSIIKGNTDIKKLDNNTKKRLINLCNERIDFMNKKIKRKFEKIEEAENILKKIKK